MAIYIIFSNFTNPYVFFINGVGKLNLQTFSAVISLFSIIPLQILLVKKFGFGIEGILIVIILSVMVSYILFKSQTKKIINKTAVGIWSN
jgi:O-antigen/teichoic acid export membrane protein